MRRRSRPAKPRDTREGFWFNGRWITPDEAHRMCKELMDRVDKLPKHVREYIHEHELPPPDYRE